MESWSSVHEVKGLLPSETTSSSDNCVRTKTDFVGVLDINNELSSCQQTFETDEGFGEFDYQELIGLIETSNSSLMVSPNSTSLEDDSNSRLSSSMVDSKGRESSFIDLKLGSLGDLRCSQISGTPKGIPVMSSSYESFRSPKSVRIGVSLHAVYCQVLGCNKDLSSSKEYHKRHKVCELHSKAASVIVNGLIQRFCQQCSRFHLLAEFDNGKRSCRKRLQEHNNRRRKPRAGVLPARTERLFKRYDGSMNGKFHGTASRNACFIGEDMLPNGLIRPKKSVANDWRRQINIQDGTRFNPVSVIPMTGSTYGDNSKQNSHSMEGPSYGSGCLYKETSTGSEDLTAFDAASAFHGLSTGITQSSCALNLLSPQSSNSSSHSSGIPTVHYNTNQVSEKTMSFNSQASNCKVPDQYFSTRSFAEDIHLSPILNFVVTNGIYHRSNPLNCADHLSSEDNSTINLLQLSPRLQRVKQQKQSTQTKEENDSFCWPHIA